MTRPRRYRPASRIWARAVRRVDLSVVNGAYCLDYPSGNDYGSLRLNGRQERAHRIAWLLARRRPIPAGRMVTHACGRRPCIEGRHLRLGTAASNARDAIAHGRIPRGSRHWAAKLTEADVIAIRAKRRAGGVLLRDLADELGVARTTLGAAARGASWRHVGEVAA